MTMGHLGNGERHRARIRSALAVVVILVAVALTLLLIRVRGDAPIPDAVIWEPDPPAAYGASERPLTDSEITLVRRRAEQIASALRSTRSLRDVAAEQFGIVTTARLDAASTAIQQRITLYVSSKSPLWRHSDTDLSFVRWAADEVLSIELNWRADPAAFVETPALQPLVRQLEPPAGETVFPVTDAGSFGQAKLFANVIVMTPAGRPVVIPAPFGPVLDVELQRVQQRLAQMKRTRDDMQQRIDRLSDPRSVFERRRERELALARMPRFAQPHPRTLEEREARLDEMHREDLRHIDTLRAFLNPDLDRDARSALQAVETTLANLDATGRSRQACGRIDQTLDQDFRVRWSATGEIPECHPMWRMDPDLLTAARTAGQVKLAAVRLRAKSCVNSLARSLDASISGTCAASIAILRELDWKAIDHALGW